MKGVIGIFGGHRKMCGVCVCTFLKVVKIAGKVCPV